VEALAAISADEQFLLARRATAHSAEVLVAQNLSLRREDTPNVHKVRNGVVMFLRQICRGLVQEKLFELCQVLALSFAQPLFLPLARGHAEPLFFSSDFAQALTMMQGL